MYQIISPHIQISTTSLSRCVTTTSNNHQHNNNKQNHIMPPFKRRRLWYQHYVIFHTYILIHSNNPHCCYHLQFRNHELCWLHAHTWWIFAIPIRDGNWVCASAGFPVWAYFSKARWGGLSVFKLEWCIPDFVISADLIGTAIMVE